LFTSNQSMIKYFLTAGVAAATIAPVSAATFNDVAPTNWAYSAIQNLNARYGCIAGYPNGTLKPESDATREEVFALANHCLDNITTFYTQADAQLASALRAEIGAVSTRVTTLETAAKTAAQRRELGVNNYGGVAFAGAASNSLDNNGDRVTNSGVTLQGRVKAFEFGNQFAISARPYVTFAGAPDNQAGAVFGGGLGTLDIPLARRTLADGTKVSAANLYLGAGGQAGGNQGAGIGVAGLEASVAKNIVLFADAKIPFSNTGVENVYGDQSYNVTGTVGLGFKF
jgi:hypothetical protein